MNIDELYTADLHEEGSEMQVKDQFGEATDAFITLVGLDSKCWKKAYAVAQRQIIENNDKDAEFQLFSSASIGWRGFVFNGKEITFSKGAVKKLYKKAPYIMKQVDEHISNRANFFKR